MSISGMGLQSTFDPFVEKRYIIEGVCYSEMELKQYIREREQELSKETVCQRLRTMEQNLSKTELVQKDDLAMLFRQENTNGKILFIGNALFLAMYAQDYELVEKLVKKKLPIQDGLFLTVADNGHPAIPWMEEQNVWTLEMLLKKPRQMPEEVWFSLWEQYAKQRKRLSWPERPRKEAIFWLDDLALLQEKRPQIYNKAVTEEFFNQLLISCVRGQMKISKKDWNTVRKKVKALSFSLQDQQLMWNQLIKYNKNMIEERVWAGDYIRLWKAIAQKRVVLDVLGKEGVELDIEQQVETKFGFHQYDFFTALFGAVDRVKNAEFLNQDSLFEYVMTEGNEENMITALKIDLISSGMLENAFSYAKEHQQDWAYPLLILKHHGEWQPEVIYEA